MSTLIVKAGDRVRVTWEVTSKGGDEDSSGHILICNSGARGGSAYVPASCVEVLAQPVRVGDIVEGEDAYEALPFGAVVVGAGSGVYVRTRDGFVDEDEYKYGPRGLTGPRTVVYLRRVAA